MPRNFVSLFGSGGDVLPSAGGPSPFVLIQSQVATDGGGGSASINMTVTEGNSLIAISHWSDAVTLTSITCSGESNLSAIGSVITSANSTKLHMLRLDAITASGAKTITCTWSAPTANAQFWLAEISGGNTASLLGQEGGTTGTGTTPTINLTTATNGEMGLVACSAEGGELTPGAGFTVIVLSNTNLWEEGEYKLDLGAAGLKTLSMTVGSAPWAIKAATFKALGG